MLRERLRALLAELARERAGADEKTALLAGTRSELEHTIKALAADALRSNNESFLELARTQLDAEGEGGRAPRRADQGVARQGPAEVKKLELDRQRDVGELDAAPARRRRRRASACGSGPSLDHGAAGVRGARRLGRDAAAEAVESAGMLAYCDFVEQVTTSTATAASSGPTWSCGCRAAATVVVDAKAPLEAAARRGRRDRRRSGRATRWRFARHVSQHVASLEAKAYWRQFEGTSDFVVMFLPGRELLLRRGRAGAVAVAERRFQVCEPMTLISLLR